MGSSIPLSDGNVESNKRLVAEVMAGANRDFGMARRSTSLLDLRVFDKAHDTVSKDASIHIKP